MTDNTNGFDCDGRTLVIGMRVHLLRLDATYLAMLPADERDCLEEMLREPVEVFELRDSIVRVERVWDRGDGRTEHHLLTVPTADVRRADDASDRPAR